MPFTQHKDVVVRAIPGLRKGTHLRDSDSQSFPRLDSGTSMAFLKSIPFSHTSQCIRMGDRNMPRVLGGPSVVCALRIAMQWRLYSAEWSSQDHNSSVGKRSWHRSLPVATIFPSGLSLIKIHFVVPDQLLTSQRHAQTGQILVPHRSRPLRTAWRLTVGLES
jgi:hypothetical protein